MGLDVVNTGLTGNQDKIPDDQYYYEGMAGVSRLLGLMTITEMQNVQRFLSSELSLGTDTSKQLEMTTVSLKQPEEDIVTSPVKTYASCSAKIVKQIQAGVVMN